LTNSVDEGYLYLVIILILIFLSKTFSQKEGFLKVLSNIKICHASD